MGRIKQGILGGFSKKVGSVIGGSWKGIAYMRSMPLSVANPRTTGQVLQRNNMKGVVKASQQLLPDVIIPNWNRFAVKMSGYNDFVRTNIRHYTDGVLTSPNLLMIAKGKMTPSPITSVGSSVAGGFAVINWLNVPAGSFQSSNDIAVAVVYFPDLEVFVPLQSLITRNDGTLSIPLPDGVSVGMNYWSYLAFRREDGTVVSNSEPFYASLNT